MEKKNGMSSARMKVITIIMVLSMMKNEVVVSAHNCMMGCTRSCGSGFACHLKCEWRCLRSNSARFFGPANVRKAATLPRGSLNFPTPSPSPSRQADGLGKRRRVTLN
ncbi:hypothetical protein V6N13_088238 [Hibiscus sabdariffa]|uniref:Secreted protein n=1 Tax=Hibiscus sabdariffa TaxID=183260 RepID=A0ABR2FZ41_9ROSI